MLKQRWRRGRPLYQSALKCRVSFAGGLGELREMAGLAPANRQSAGSMAEGGELGNDRSRQRAVAPARRRQQAGTAAARAWRCGRREGQLRIMGGGSGVFIELPLLHRSPPLATLRHTADFASGGHRTAGRGHLQGRRTGGPPRALAARDLLSRPGNPRPASRIPQASPSLACDRNSR